MNIILCGPPFTGKTTLGQQAAQKLGWNFNDTDRLLEKFYADEKKSKLTCREIHRKEGEERFRDYESQAVASLQGCEKHVIALGGGSLNHAHNVKILKKLGTLLYIKTSLEILQKRLLSGPLPSYLENEIDPLMAYRELVEARSFIYEKHADKIIETDTLSQAQIISIICEGYYANKIVPHRDHRGPGARS